MEIKLVKGNVKVYNKAKKNCYKECSLYGIYNFLKKIFVKLTSKEDFRKDLK